MLGSKALHGNDSNDDWDEQGVRSGNSKAPQPNEEASSKRTRPNDGGPNESGNDEKIRLSELTVTTQDHKLTC